MVEGAPLLNPPGESGPADLWSRPSTMSSGELAAIKADRALIRIPSNFQRLKAADKALALEWRLHTRELFEWAFVRGYRAIDLLTDLQPDPLADTGWSYYLLERPAGTL
jgi:predicted GNAT superfamily acetyltransferase